MHVSVPICGTWGISRTVSFPLCCCCDTLLGVRLPAEPDFQPLDENPHLWWLSLPFLLYLVRALLLSQGQYPVTLLHTPSFSYSQSLLNAVPEFPVYQDSTESLILTFSMKIAPLGEFLHKRPCAGYPLSVGLFLVLFGRVPDAPPKFKGDCCPFV